MEMDESVELFKAEQRRFAEEGGFRRAIRRQLQDYVLGLSAYILINITILHFLGQLPRNPDHSMQLGYYGPVLAVLGVGSVLLLRRPSFRRSPFRVVAWGQILLALAAIPAGVIDAFTRGGV